MAAPIRLRLLAALLVTASLGATAPAAPAPRQDDGGQSAVFEAVQGSLLSTIANDDAKAAAKDAKSKAIAGATTRYAPDLARRKRNLAGFVAKSRKTDPQGADAMQAAFAETDPIVALGPALKPFGLKTDDVADAMAVYVINAWYASRGRDDDPTPAQAKAVRDQMSAALLATSQFAKANDALKQELAEALFVQAILASQTVAYGKEHPEYMEKFQNAVAKGAKASFGFDLMKMDLTETGLKLKS